MHWEDVKATVRKDLFSRSLAQPRRRLNALDGLERLLVASYPGLVGTPERLLRFTKPEIVAALSNAKGTPNLSGAEASVLNDVLAVLQGDEESRVIAPAGAAEPTEAVSVPARSNESQELVQVVDADRKQGLPPVVDDNSRVLILGTLPGDESLRQQRYYSHPRNQFWPIVSSIYSATLSTDYDERVAFLLEHGIALWDVLKTAERAGSLDSAIKTGTPNNFVRLFNEHPSLRTVGFNGGKAETLFDRLVRGSLPQEVTLRTQVLPSSSGTPGRGILPVEEKIVRWKAVFEQGGDSGS